MRIKSVKEYLAGKRSRKIISMAIATNFIDNEICDAIEAEFDKVRMEDNSISVNIAVPFEAYGHLDEFLTECRKILEPLGYKCYRSHDGVGVNDTLFVECKWK